MKLAIRIGLALCVVGVAGLVALAIALPRLVQSDDVRARIEQAAREATGRDLQFGELTVGFLPPSLRMVAPRLSGESADAPPLVEAREISLRIALLPLLFRTVLIDALVVDGGTLRLERTRDGLQLPQPAPASAGVSASGAEAAEASGSAASALDLAVRSVRLRDSRLLLVDRSVRPAATWDLTDLDATARGDSLDGPIDVALSTALASGGRLEVSGTTTRHGDVALEVGLDAFALTPVAPYLGRGVEAEGRVTGTVALQGPMAALSRLTADVRGEEVRFRQDDVSLRGEVAIEADVADPTGAAEGRFEVDATDAALGFGGGFTKPPGTVAEVTGRVVGASGGGYAFEDVRLKIKNLDAKGRIGSTAPLQIEASAAPFDLAGWEAILPALADSPPRGRLGFTGLRLDGDPKRLRGALELRNLAVGASEIVLNGGLVAQGTSIRSEAVTLRLAGETIPIDATVSEVFGKPRHRIITKSTGTDSNRVFGALFSKRDAIEGPLALDVALSGAFGADLRSSLTGRIEFGVEPGRLVDVSLLKLAIAQLGSVGTLALGLGKSISKGGLERYYGDAFEHFHGVLEIGGGRARTNDLTVRYPDYGVVLRGTLDLDDLGLDMKGDLTINEEIDGTIAGALGLKDHQARPRVLTLASVRGTLDDPKVSVSASAVASLVAAYGMGGNVFGGTGSGTGTGTGTGTSTGTGTGTGKEVGTDAGVLVNQGLGVLQDILKSRKKRASEPEEQPEAAPAPESPEEAAPEASL